MLLGQSKKKRAVGSLGWHRGRGCLPASRPAALPHAPKPRKFVCKRYFPATLPHLLLVRVRTSLALGLDQTPPRLGGSGALRGGDLDGQRRLELLDGDFVHAALVLLLAAPVLQALGSHEGLDVATCLWVT